MDVILDKILPYVNISFLFWAMEIQEKLFLGFTDLYERTDFWQDKVKANKHGG